MKILFLVNKKEQPMTLLDELIKTESIEEVAELLSGIRNRTIFIHLINDLLNELSSVTQENKELIKQLKEKELEII